MNTDGTWKEAKPRRAGPPCEHKPQRALKLIVQALAAVGGCWGGHVAPILATSLECHIWGIPAVPQKSSHYCVVPCILRADASLRSVYSGHGPGLTTQLVSPGPDPLIYFPRVRRRCRPDSPCQPK